MAIKNLHQLLDALVAELFAPEDRRIDGLVVELDRANREIKKTPHPGFMHGGEVYLPRGCKKPNIVPSLSFKLSNQAAAFMQEKKILEDDRQLIRQILWLATKDCESMEDIRNALPESIVNLSNVLKSMPRMRTDGYTLTGNDRLYMQYVIIRDKIDTYWACSMIY